MTRDDVLVICAGMAFRSTQERLPPNTCHEGGSGPATAVPTCTMSLAAPTSALVHDRLGRSR
jgi:hypothetical protein